MESWIISQTNLGEQVTLKKIVDRFESKPYGWDLGSIEVVLGWLVGNGKVALTVDANQVARSEAAALIRNTGKQQHTVVAPQKAYEATKVAAFKKFCTDFFDEGAVPSDSTELARFGRDKLAAKREELNALVSASRYPFVSQLSGVVTLLDQVVGKPIDWYLSDFDTADDLIEAKEDLVDPIKSFLNGQQAKIFDEAQALLSGSTGNLGYLPAGSADLVKTLLADTNAFRGNKMNQLKAAADTLRGQIDEVVSDRRSGVTAAIEGRKAEVLASAYFANAASDAQESVILRIDQILARLVDEREIALILQVASTFEQDDYPELLSRLVASQQGGGNGAPPPKQMVSVKTIHVSGISGVLESEGDVDNYLAALRTALVETLNNGKRITL
jgi:hypothetical protein